MTTTVHNLPPGFYLVDHATGEVIAGPYGQRRQVAPDAPVDQPYCVLEVVGPQGCTVPWCVAPTAPLAQEEAKVLPAYKRSYKERVADGELVAIPPPLAISDLASEIIPDAEPAADDTSAG